MKFWLPLALGALFFTAHSAVAKDATKDSLKDSPKVDARFERMSYTMLPDDNPTHAEKIAEVKKAMDDAVALYNALGVFGKQITASYNPKTPTADGNYNGNIRFGGQIGRRTALHELGHVLGVGTYQKWNELMVDGKWTGPHALAQLRAFDGPDAVLHGDRQHFWPYGLNYEKESSPENDRRHVLMVAAFRRDMGIDSKEDDQK